MKGGKGKQISLNEEQQLIISPSPCLGWCIAVGRGAGPGSSPRPAGSHTAAPPPETSDNPLDSRRQIKSRHKSLRNNKNGRSYRERFTNYHYRLCIWLCVCISWWSWWQKGMLWVGKYRIPVHAVPYVESVIGLLCGTNKTVEARRITVYNSNHRVSECPSFVGIGSPTPSPSSECVSPLTTGQKPGTLYALCTGFRIRIDLMRIRIRIRIQHFF